ncbi:MAG: histidinol-phosphate transaminase [Rhodospirillaceae bacterium]|nr:histidinol-phosphate transaminase [Rhodospirillaceae bacterium]
MNDRTIIEVIPNPLVRSMPTWVPPSLFKKRFTATSHPKRMHLNESPYPPSPSVIDAMKKACEAVNRYPDAHWQALVTALAERTGIPAARIVLGNGSDELIASAGRIALMPGDTVIAPVPSFASFAKAALINGASLRAVKVRKDGACDVEAMLEAIDETTRLLFLATPNNPTGAMLTASEVRKVAMEVPETCLLVVDEAYHEFAMQAGGEDPLPVLNTRTGPWVVFRSFSKAYGLAGIRVGYGICGSEEVVGGFQLARNAFTVNAIAQAGALAALQDTEHMESIVAAMATERERVSAGLRGLGCETFPSVANFVTARTRLAAVDVMKALEARGILISRLSTKGFENHIRVTVGKSEETNALLSEMRKILEA